MTTEQIKHWYEGRDLWYEYQRVNRIETSINLKREHVARLARLLDLSQAHIERRIYFYLNN